MYFHARPCGLIDKHRPLSNRFPALLITLLMIFMSSFPAFASETELVTEPGPGPERPIMVWLGVGGGLACEKNEQYSPLTQTGPAFRLEGGWAIRGRYLLWDGQIAYSAGTVSSSRGGEYEIDTQTVSCKTGVFGLLPARPFSTVFALGVSLEGGGIFTEGLYAYEQDLYNALFIGASPAVLIENKALDRWTFRLRLSMPLALYSWGPSWVNNSGGETEGRWNAISDALFLEGKVSAGLRITDRIEGLLLYSCVVQRYEEPFVSRKYHNYLGLGVEMDFGGAK